MLTWLEIGQLAVKWRSRMYHSYFVRRKLGYRGWLASSGAPRFSSIVSVAQGPFPTLYAPHLWNEGVGWSDFTPSLCSLEWLSPLIPPPLFPNLVLVQFHHKCLESGDPVFQAQAPAVPGMLLCHLASDNPLWFEEWNQFPEPTALLQHCCSRLWTKCAPFEICRFSCLLSLIANTVLNTVSEALDQCFSTLALLTFWVR